MLTVSKDSTVIQENEYNHEGIRIAKTENDVTRKYFYDNGSVAYTEDDNNLSSANILGGYQNVIGTYRTSGESEDYYVYHKDIQGSTSCITDSSLNTSNIYEYSDFGEVTVSESDIDNEICYTGAIYDETTGLHYMNARYYDPSNGRFISQDSYRGELDDYGQWHLYVYCANNPINYTDPSGHVMLELGVVSSVVIVITVAITITYVSAQISSSGTNLKSFSFEFKNRKKNDYKVEVDIHKPDKYNKKSGLSAMKARWEDMKGTKKKKLTKFIENHRWRYHAHIRIYKNGELIKKWTL